MGYYKSREDEPGYIEGQRRANETDAEYAARLAEMRQRYAHEISEALGLDTKTSAPRPVSTVGATLISFGITAVIIAPLMAVLSAPLSMIVGSLIFGFVLTIVMYFYGKRRQERA